MHAQPTPTTFWSRCLAVTLTVGLSVLAIFMLFGAMVLAIVLAASAVLLNLVRGRRIAPVDLRWRSAAGARAAGPTGGGEVVDVTAREVDAGASR